MTRKIVAAVTGLLLLYWLPADIESIRYGLATQPGLSVGISIKITMHVLAVVGLVKDMTFGYVFLFGATLQGMLVSTSAVRAVPMADWWLHKGQLIGPALDTLLRLACLGFLATRPERLVGRERSA